MADTPITSYYVNGWKGGWQPDLAVNQLQPDMITDLMNVTFTEGFGLKKRHGYIRLNSTGLVAKAQQVFFPRVFTSTGEHPNLTQRVMYFDEPDSKLWYETLGRQVDGIALINSGHTMGHSQLNTAVNYFRCWNLQVLTFGSDIWATGFKWDGKSSNGAVVETDDGTTGSSAPSKPLRYNVQTGVFSRVIVHPLDGTAVGFPAARCVVTKYDRIFAANLYKKGVYRYPSRLYFNGDEASGNFDAQKWMTNSFIEIGGDDGTEVTSLLPFAESLLIFKNSSVWTLLGNSEDTFTLYELDHRIGTEATYGTVATAGAAYFFDSQTGVWSYNGANFTNISEAINGHIFSLLNRESIFKVVLSVHQDQLYLSIPIGEEKDDANGTSDHNSRTFVYDMRLGLWSQWDIGWTGYPSEYYTDYSILGVSPLSRGNMVTGCVERTLGVAKLGNIETDNGVNFASFFETAWFNPGNTGDRHRLRRLELLVSPSGPVLDVTVFRNFDDTTVWGSGTVDPSGATQDWWHLANIHYDIGLWTWLKVKVSKTSATAWQVSGLATVLSDRTRLRGGLSG